MEIRSRAFASGLLVLLALVVFAGTASAVTLIQRTPDRIVIANGETDTFTVKVLPSLTTDSGDAAVEIYAPENGLEIVMKDVDGNILATGTGSSRVTAQPISYTSGVEKVFYVGVTNNGAPTGEYGIKFAANDGTFRWGDDAILWAGVESGVPEFTTVAVPVAAILGLVLFFNYRKRRGA